MRRNFRWRRPAVWAAMVVSLSRRGTEHPSPTIEAIGVGRSARSTGYGAGSATGRRHASSSSSQPRSVTPAAIAGVTLRLWCIRPKLYHAKCSDSAAFSGVTLYVRVERSQAAWSQKAVEFDAVLGFRAACAATTRSRESLPRSREASPWSLPVGFAALPSYGNPLQSRPPGCSARIALPPCSSCRSRKRDREPCRPRS